MKNKRLTLQQREERTAWLTLIPLCTILLVFRFIPIVIDFVMSFTNWDGGFKADFVGFNNYITLAKNGELWTMLKNSLLLLLYLPIRLFIAFIFALYIYEKLPGAKTFSILYYLPQMISLVVLGSVIKYVFRGRGIINMLLQAIGLEDKATAYPVVYYKLSQNRCQRRVTAQARENERFPGSGYPN